MSVAINFIEDLEVNQCIQDNYLQIGTKVLIFIKLLNRKKDSAPNGFDF